MGPKMLKLVDPNRTGSRGRASKTYTTGGGTCQKSGVLHLEIRGRATPENSQFTWAWHAAGCLPAACYNRQDYSLVIVEIMPPQGEKKRGSTPVTWKLPTIITSHINYIILITNA